jgi:ribose-phosphate pyrophosphokinase
MLFALNASRDLGDRVAEQLDVSLSAHEEREFEDGEHKIRPLSNVRQRDVFVIHSLYADPQQTVNDKLCRLLFFCGALRDASVSQVTAVVPYLAYARKDQKSKPRDPTTTRYVAALFEAVGVERVVTLDVHNLAAFQNAFRCRTEHLEATSLFVEYFATHLRGNERVVVLSPDAGGIKRAERLRAALARRLDRDIALGFMEKTRSAGVMTAGRLVADTDGATVIVVDDIISTGGTLLQAARACRQQGARRVYAAATHGVFVGNAGAVLADDALERIVVTDAIPPFRLDPALVGAKLDVLSAAGLIAEAIRRIHTGGSLVELLAT